MGDEAAGVQKSYRKKFMRAEPLPPAVEAQLLRRVSLLLGLIPLAEMSQDETDWVFRQKQRLGGDD